MQAVLAVTLLVLGVLSTGATRPLLLWTAVIPVGFALVVVSAYRRGAAARAEGRWSRAFEQAEADRSHKGYGIVFAVWVVGTILVFLML